MTTQPSVAALVAVALATVLVAPATAATSTADRASPSIDVTGDRVTADLADARMRDVLAIIVRRARVRVVSAGALHGTLTARWRDLTLEQALRRLLAPADLVFFYTKDGQDPATAPRLAEVRVYGTSATRPREADDAVDGVSTQTRDAGETPIEPGAHDPARILQDSDDHRARLRAVQAIAGRDDASAIEILARAVQDEDAGVRESAVKALARSWDERAVEPIADALRGDTDADVREAAARALGTLWTTAAADALGVALASDRSRSVREAAAEALAILGDPDTVPALVAALRDTDGAVRERAAEALGALRSTAAIGALLQAASHDGDPWVREQAAQSAAALVR